MLMRTHSHSLALLRECCALLCALCVDIECATHVAQSVVLGALSTAMWLHARNDDLLLGACRKKTDKANEGWA